eukprot:scaffold1442_cov128-Cylindrotheca_fusiformis.AAC.42
MKEHPMRPVVRHPPQSNRFARYPFLTVTTVAFLSYLLASYYVGTEKDADGNTMKSSSQPSTGSTALCDIKYILGDKEDQGFLRYKAIDTKSELNVSIDRWIQCMSGTNSEKLAQEITDLIKARSKMEWFSFNIRSHIFSLALFLACPFEGFRFETKGVTADSAKDVPFEFVLVNDDNLYQFASDSNPDVFADMLKTCPNNPNACAFSNLGGDAMLVSPKNIADGNAADDHNKNSKNRYGHLAAFLRKAPTNQIPEVWKLVAETYQQRLESRSPDPVWFSTAGGGVAWLHFRFDTRPKYYRYSPFKQTFYE